jgi:peptidoglycan-associated lipoprotein
MKCLRLVPVAVVALALVGFVGCPKKKVEPATPAPAPAPAKPAEPVAPPPAKEVTEPFKPAPVQSDPIADASVDDLNNRIRPLKTVYFSYDSSDLDDAARAVLQANADWLKKYTKRTVRIEGHCDERGTIKYNLALGERRANAAREYLESLGVSGSRLRIVTFGEEKPAVPGSGEETWRQNRRGEFWIES